jgi:hypothetical protein
MAFIYVASDQCQSYDDDCDCLHDCRDNDCEKWMQFDRVLRHEMRLPPWEFPTCGRRLVGHCDADCVARYHMLKAAADQAVA